MAREDLEKTYAVLYLRPDGWWVAGEGWADKQSAKEDAFDQMGHRQFKVVLVGGKPYCEAKELEAREEA